MELKDVDLNEIEKNKRKAKRVNTEILTETKDDTIKQTNRYQSTYDDLYDSKTVKKKVIGKGYLVASLVLFLLSMTILAATYFFVKVSNEKEPEVSLPEVITYSQEEVNTMVGEAVDKAITDTETNVKKEYLNTLHEATSIETGTWNLLRSYFPDEVVFTDGTKFTYIGVDKSLKQNNLDNNRFVRDPLTGYVSYNDENGNKTSYFGIDVSTFQKEIDWEKVAAAGVEFAIIRCGFRGYGSGKIVEDNYFKANIEGAIANGIPVGVYFYTQAISEEEAVEEADFVLSMIEPYDVKGPVVIDVEPVSDTARTDGLTGEQITDFTIAFCERVEGSGHTPMVYSGIKYFIRLMDTERLEPYAKWYAYYNDPLYFPYEISIWQYSMSGTVDGINGTVDLNILFDKWW